MLVLMLNEQCQSTGCPVKDAVKWICCCCCSSSSSSSLLYLPNNTTVCTSTSIQLRRAGQQGPTRTLTAALKRVINQLLGTCSFYHTQTHARARARARARTHTHTHTHTHPFNGPFSGTTQMSRMPFRPPNQQRQSTEGNMFFLSHK